MTPTWLPLLLVLSIVGFYVFLALYLLCRFVGGWALASLQPERQVGRQPSLPAWTPPAEALEESSKKTAALQA